MGDPVTLVESANSPITAIPTVIAEENQEGSRTTSANKNGKKADSESSGSSFFIWFIVLALLGVWTSVAAVYFDLVDYQGVLGKLVAYDTDGDGDFDVEDAKVLLDEKPGGVDRKGEKRETSPKNVGLKLREALKQQVAIIHERLEAKKLAKLALAEVRELLAKEEEEKELELGRKEMLAKVKERVATRLKEEEDKLEREEMEKALEKLRKEKAKELDEKVEEEKGGEKRLKKGGEKEEKSEKKGEGKKEEEDRERSKESGNEKRKKSKAEKSEKGGNK